MRVGRSGNHADGEGVPLRMPRYPIWPLSAFLVTSSCLFIGIVLWELIGNGPFWWHILQPQSWQGGIEALVLIALLVLSQRFKRGRVRLWAMLLISEVYLRRHAVDFALLVDLLFLEVLIALGVLIHRLSGSKVIDTQSYLRCFVLGFCVWSACAWGLSALGYGSVVELRGLTALLGLVAIAGRSKPLAAFGYGRVSSLAVSERMSCAMLLGWLLVLFARTNSAVGFDPLWYGLRGEHVLVGEGSAFASSGLVSAVHYAPKLYELLLIPVSALGNAGVISGMTLMMFTLLAMVCNELLRQLGVTDKIVRIWIVIACVTIPAISNSALDPKPDLIAALLLMIAWLHGNDFVRNRSAASALWIVSCLILAVHTKLTAIPYSAAFVVALLFITFLRHRNLAFVQIVERDGLPLALCALCLAAIVAIFVTSRTLVLTGLPTIGPDALFRLWQWAGFNLKEPAGTINWTQPQNWEDVPWLALDLLFRPQKLVHIVITWTGNIWLWLGGIAIITSMSSTDAKTPSIAGKYLAVASCATGLVLMFSVAYNGSRGSDGNYFIAAIVPAVLATAESVWGRIRSECILVRTFVGCLAAFSLFQAAYCFHSASWATGTRAFDLNFTGGIHQFDEANRSLLSSSGLGKIDRYLHDLRRPVRVVTCIDDGLDFRLPVRSESVDRISFSRWQYVGREGQFSKFLGENRIDFLVMPIAGDGNIKCDHWPQVEKAVKQIGQNVSVTALRGEKYVMYDLSDWRQQ
jgi:hypothetical protein